MSVGYDTQTDYYQRLRDQQIEEEERLIATGRWRRGPGGTLQPVNPQSPTGVGGSQMDRWRAQQDEERRRRERQQDLQGDRDWTLELRARDEQARIDAEQRSQEKWNEQTATEASNKMEQTNFEDWLKSNEAQWRVQQDANKLASEQGFTRERDQFAADAQLDRTFMGGVVDQYKALELRQAQAQQAERLAQAQFEQQMAEGLRTGKLAYTPAQDQQIAKWEDALARVQQDPAMDDDQRMQAITQLQQRIRSIVPRQTRPDQQGLSIEEAVKKGTFWDGGQFGKGQPWVVDPKTGQPQVARGYKAPETEMGYPLKLRDAERKDMAFQWQQQQAAEAANPVSKKNLLSTLHKEQKRLNDMAKAKAQAEGAEKWQFYTIQDAYQSLQEQGILPPQGQGRQGPGGSPQDVISQAKAAGISGRPAPQDVQVARGILTDMQRKYGGREPMLKEEKQIKWWATETLKGEAGAQQARGGAGQSQVPGGPQGIRARPSPSDIAKAKAILEDPRGKPQEVTFWAQEVMKDAWRSGAAQGQGPQPGGGQPAAVAPMAPGAGPAQAAAPMDTDAAEAGPYGGLIPQRTPQTQQSAQYGPKVLAAIQAARNGDVKAQEALRKWGISWQ